MKKKISFPKFKKFEIPWSSIIFGILLGISLSVVHLIVGKIIRKTLTNDLDNDISNETIVASILSTISSIISYYIAMKLRLKFFNKRIFYKHPLIDISGIILGSFTVILINYIIIVIKQKYSKK